MNWLQLLSSKRIGEPSQRISIDIRSRFDQDFDRVVFSHPFRKLQDKTQVMPLPEDDFVHNRLTHSLEVSSVARSLGRIVGKSIVERHEELQNARITHQEFGAITSAAALAHDIGNPPFGHSGEAGISHYFLKPERETLKNSVSDREWCDLINFEGNAQGFRLLSDPEAGGLRLTLSTLAAFTKYPRTSFSEKIEWRKSQKKYGLTCSEAHLFEEIAGELGLLKLGENAWVRHPLAFLVEAADDICYHIIDLEDGTRLGLIPFAQTEHILSNIIGEKYSKTKLDAIPDINEKLGTLRALAIGELIQEVSQVFLDNEKGLLEGKFDSALLSKTSHWETLKEIISISIEKIYRSKMVLSREITGLEVLSNLIAKFEEAALAQSTKITNPIDGAIFRLFPESTQRKILATSSPYEVSQHVLDFVSGLTDSSALKLHKTISGTSEYF